MTKDDSNKEIIFSENIPETNIEPSEKLEFNFLRPKSFTDYCLLYTSDAADE